MVENKKIVVIGSANVDFIMKLPHLPKVGESVTNGQFLQTFGGKGANQAVAAARTGGDVWFLNCIGDDAYGEKIRQNLADAGAHTEFMWKAAGFPTGAAVVLIGEEGKNLPTIDPGANNALTAEMVLSVKDALLDAALFVLQYEMPEETLYTALSLAREANIQVVFNCAPPHPIDTTKINGVDYLIVNETEAEFLVGVAVHDQVSSQAAAQAMLSLGAKTVIITLGEKGAFVASTESMMLVPAPSVVAVDSTGAGDTFCGTFAVALTEGKDLMEAVCFANAAAALCVTQLGAQPSIPSRQQIDDFLNENRRAME